MRGGISLWLHPDQPVQSARIACIDYTYISSTLQSHLCPGQIDSTRRDPLRLLVVMGDPEIGFRSLAFPLNPISLVSVPCFLHVGARPS